jgi:4-alpha-glucanotransferase
MRASFALYDVLRVDHFRGLESYYAIPSGSASASGGRWRAGPGMDFVNAVKEELPQARVIAEDLGFLTPETRSFLKVSGFPGMKVLQFAFDAREPGDYSPYGYGLNNAVYTGTHDNDTALGWALSAPKAAVAHAMAYAGINDIAELPKAFIRLALQNRAVLAIVPLQDWLGLGSEARFNVPSTVGGRNWRWRMGSEALSPKLAEEMRSLAALYGRE